MEKVGFVIDKPIEPFSLGHLYLKIPFTNLLKIQDFQIPGK